MPPRKFCRFFPLQLALSIASAAAAINVFYSCRDNPIQYASKFSFDCSNPNEVVYVESAIIGFTPLYNADNNVFECPITNDTCTKTTSGPSTLCDGHNECYLAQRILLYNESGLQCNIANINGTNGSGANRGGNFINVNYSCISRDLCSPLAGYKGRYICSTPTISNTTASASLSFSTTGNFATSTNFIHLNTNKTDVTRGSTGAMSSSSDTLGARSSISQEPTVVSKGAIAGIVVAVLVSVAAIIGLTVYALRYRTKRKRENNNPLPRPEDLTDEPQGDRRATQQHAFSSSSSSAPSLSEVPRDAAIYEKLNRPNELSPVYYNLASIDHDYQQLQITN